MTVESYDCAIRYAGEYLAAETGLYYLRIRYYNPYIGRFISEDSYCFEEWSEFLGNSVITAAVLDRLTCQSRFLCWKAQAGSLKTGKPY